MKILTYQHLGWNIGLYYSVFGYFQYPISDKSFGVWIAENEQFLHPLSELI